MSEWEYHPPPDIDASLTEHLRNFPRQPYMLMYALRSIFALLLRGWMRVYHRLRIDGRENLPEQGSFVLVCNHTSHLDALCLCARCRCTKSIAPFRRRLQTTFSRVCPGVLLLLF